mmetsp:Transcript_67178/g.193151  ORF Transcript_67178/g.193151 Transcript_67178/m.193151 type:complete len:298 (+) Transcript_67178:556-1449(+)
MLPQPTGDQALERNHGAPDVDHVRETQMYVDKHSQRLSQSRLFARPPWLRHSPPTCRAICLHALDDVLWAQIPKGCVVADHDAQEQDRCNHKRQDRRGHQSPRLGRLSLQSGHRDDDGEDENRVGSELSQLQRQAQEALVITRPHGVVLEIFASAALLWKLAECLPCPEASPEDHGEDPSGHKGPQKRGLVQEVADVHEHENERLGGEEEAPPFLAHACSSGQSLSNGNDRLHVLREDDEAAADHREQREGARQGRDDLAWAPKCQKSIILIGSRGLDILVFSNRLVDGRAYKPHHL